MLLQEGHQGLPQGANARRFDAAAHPAVGQDAGPPGGRGDGHQLQVAGLGREALADAGDQGGLLASGPAIAAVEHQQEGLAAGQERFEGLKLDAGEVAIEHEKHEVGAEGHPARQAGPAGGGNLVDAWGVDQFDPLQPRNGLVPRLGLLVAGAAMGYIGGEGGMASSCTAAAPGRC